MKASGQKSPEYWKTVVKPFIETVWPKTAEKHTPEIAGHFAEICVRSRADFPDAFGCLKAWLKPVRWASFIIEDLIEKNIHAHFPTESLSFVTLISKGQSYWRENSELQLYLDNLLKVAPTLSETAEYRKLRELLSNN